jgi:arylsulfatase A-like enzyme
VKRKHIFLIMTDQQRFDTIAALGFGHMHTPNMDRLVREGTSFDNCFVNAPSCVPSRASLFNGYYPHVTGVLRNGLHWQRTWVESLAAQGYHCVNVGKMHTIPYDAKAGFHERFVCENKDRYYEGRWFADEWDKALVARSQIKPSRERYRELPDYKDRLGAYEWTLPAESHADFFVGNTADWWLQTRPKPESLFMQIGFLGPHPPYDPVASYAKHYLDNPSLPVPDPQPSDLDDLPSFLKAKRVHDSKVDHDAVLWSLKPEREQLRRLCAYYMANVSMIDEALGKLLKTMESKGYLDDSLIIFCSDHGEALGEHGLSQKWSMYDAVTRVPAIFWAPGEVQQGQRLDGLCQLFDIGATVLDWAGAPQPPGVQAQSLLPALRGEEWSGRSAVFSEQAGDVALTGASLFTMVRENRYKLVHITGSTEGQLFDLQQDPGELHNLWEDPAHQAERLRLLHLILEWRMQSSVQTMALMASAR